MGKRVSRGMVDMKTILEVASMSAGTLYIQLIQVNTWVPSAWISSIPYCRYLGDQNRFYRIFQYSGS